MDCVNDLHIQEMAKNPHQIVNPPDPAIASLSVNKAGSITPSIKCYPSRSLLADEKADRKALLCRKAREKALACFTAAKAALTGVKGA
jgi:hypothetical protein